MHCMHCHWFLCLILAAKTSAFVALPPLSSAASLGLRNAKHGGVQQAWGHRAAGPRMSTPKKDGSVQEMEGVLEGIQATWKEMMDPQFDDDQGLAAMACKYRFVLLHTYQERNNRLMSWSS